MNHSRPVLTGHHGIRPLTEVFQDEGKWVAACYWCFEHEQELIVAEGLATRTATAVKADEHEYRHAGCDPQHILHIMRVYGGEKQELSVPEINGRLFGGMGDYSFWLLTRMARKGLTGHEDRDGIRYWRAVRKEEGEDERTGS